MGSGGGAHEQGPGNPSWKRLWPWSAFPLQKVGPTARPTWSKSLSVADSVGPGPRGIESLNQFDRLFVRKFKKWKGTQINFFVGGNKKLI
jgi:hypothetical protein